MPVAEAFLRDLDEIIGRFGGFTTEATFTKVRINDAVLFLEIDTKETTEILHTLKGVKTGEQIGILRLDSKFHIRRKS